VPTPRFSSSTGNPLTPITATARNAAKRFFENNIVVVEERNERQIIEEQGMCGFVEGFSTPILAPFIYMLPVCSS